MEVKRFIRGGLREYRKHGVTSLAEVALWFISRKFTPRLRSAYYTKVYERDIEQYNVPIDPYSLTWANTDDINYKSNRQRSGWASFATDLGSVQAGDWDRNAVRRFSSRHESFKAHFQDGVPWEETEFYRQAVETISNGGYSMRMSTSEDELLQRCSEIDELYEKIRAEGYRTQEDLAIYGTRLPQLANEIQVDVGRDGTLLFVEGRHRLSIAKILDLDTVPVIIVCRHQKWVEYLEDRYQHGEQVDHPDWENMRSG